MNVQKMIDNIKTNLGNRANGKIGNQSVDTVVLDGLNLAIPHITQEAQPDYYNRVATLNLVIGQREYSLPAQDSEGVTIIVKDIYSHRCSRADGTHVSMIHLNYAEFVKKVVDYDLEITGTPYYYALWGKDNKLYLDYLPSENLTLTLFIEVYPNQLSTLDLNNALPIQDQWNLPVEAFATAYCYMKLQQVEMYQFWDDLYQKQKVSISRTESQKQSHNISGSGNKFVATEPHLNPMYKTWNN